MAMQERAVRTHRELIRCAAEVLDKEGFASSTVREISARAGVTIGALHFHFKNKQALVEAVELGAVQTLLRVIAGEPSEHPAPLQLLVDTSQTLVQRLRDDPVLRVGFALGYDATWHSGVRLWQEWRNWVELVLTAASGRGDLASDVVLDDVVFAVTTAVAGGEVLRRTDVEDNSQCAIERFWRLMLPRLAVGPVPVPPPGGAGVTGAWDWYGSNVQAGNRGGRSDWAEGTDERWERCEKPTWLSFQRGMSCPSAPGLC
ncbi:ScbR family autoregulator-binding transcription factor [Streptomyces sp. 2A115]|uniref:ScbR family autoregulator-binding transcription factor n=1 Tax=Streptomyces sp. 2A115 TaxID=3457439 RepID=UPI003FD54B1D